MKTDKNKPATQNLTMDIALHEHILDSYKYLVELQKDALNDAKEELRRRDMKVRELQLFGNINFN